MDKDNYILMLTKAERDFRVKFVNGYLEVITVDDNGFDITMEFNFEGNLSGVSATTHLNFERTNNSDGIMLFSRRDSEDFERDDFHDDDEFEYC